MLSPWLRSPSRTHTTSTSSPNFHCSSFKDIQTLIKEEPPEPDNPHHHRKKPSIFHRVRIATSILRTWTSRPPTHPDSPSGPEPAPTPSPQSSISLPGTEHLIVVYFTSLRVVRKIFEDCRTARSILRGFRVLIDERDLSMDASFHDELQRILGNKNVTLPSVFIGGSYIGGAEEIRRLHETGELKKLIERFPVVGSSVCDVCGGHRFIVCEQCNGSHKVYSEKCGFRSCSSCNQNGLIRERETSTVETQKSEKSSQVACTRNSDQKHSPNVPKPEKRNAAFEASKPASWLLLFPYEPVRLPLSVGLCITSSFQSKQLKSHCPLPHVFYNSGLKQLAVSSIRSGCNISI